MKRLVKAVVMLGLACGSMAMSGIPQAMAQTVSCEKVDSAKLAIEAAQDFAAVDTAMVAVGFTSLDVEFMQEMFSTVEQAKEAALELIEANRDKICTAGSAI